MVGGNEWEIVFRFSGAIFPVRFSFTRRDLPRRSQFGSPRK
jgi:hypothetical protein